MMMMMKKKKKKKKKKNPVSEVYCINAFLGHLIYISFDISH